MALTPLRTVANRAGQLALDSGPRKQNRPCPLGFPTGVLRSMLALRLWHPDGRWLAFADKRLVSWWRSVGGSDEGGAHGSYTASVLHAAMSLGKGLRGLSAHLTQTTSASASASSPTLVNGTDANATPGVVTVIDIQGNSWQNGGGGAGALGENIVAHFVAHHMEPLVALAFDPSGMLLLTVDKRGHRFHLFRIQPHLSGSSMSEVHQLYTLYRGDTTARIQDVAFSCDSRWVSVSSMRGTTHIFPSHRTEAPLVYAHTLHRMLSTNCHGFTVAQACQSVVTAVDATALWAVDTTATRVGAPRQG
ncbi:breast carcinoma-amplified sequence 3 homolog [Nilaparvata lugens]|uniref:breast carcinoma-amplified sequence 3 homolog n=1 Tax=Nilaparvata lugens TaxID=108931 RepID=UPI00193E8084|nr:breast carcinoma-amplified sequence 3 homolog [Nilaparvata lugens]